MATELGRESVDEVGHSWTIRYWAFKIYPRASLRINRNISSLAAYRSCESPRTH